MKRWLIAGMLVASGCAARRVTPPTILAPTVPGNIFEGRSLEGMEHWKHEVERRLDLECFPVETKECGPLRVEYGYAVQEFKQALNATLNRTFAWNLTVTLTVTDPNGALIFAATAPARQSDLIGKGSARPSIWTVLNYLASKAPDLDANGK